MKSEKVVYVDFCNTITNFTTLGPFYNYIYSHNKLKIIINFILRALSRVFRFNTADQQLRLIVGTHRNEINQFSKDFFTQKIKPQLNEDVIQILREYYKKGYKIVVVSGALREYIQHIEEVVPINQVIAKEFEYSGSKATGAYINAPCYYHDKVLQIERFEHSLQAEIVDRVAISDCADDIPMLLYANKQYVVRPKELEFRQFSERRRWEILE